MSARLADDLATRTGHPVPYGVHPAAYLGAVLTERQRREWTRAQGYAFQQQAQGRQYAPQHYTPQQPQHPAPPVAPATPPAPPSPPASGTGFAPPA